jgi:1-aminocyclopropane-1-carboxylate deaminase/D-cysteine desulfhydrase-like pyridoxal-dependent ACC family enzyme
MQGSVSRGCLYVLKDKVPLADRRRSVLPAVVYTVTVFDWAITAEKQRNSDKEEKVLFILEQRLFYGLN